MRKGEGTEMDTIGTPARLRKGTCYGQPGVYWAWKVDGYFDIHHAPEGVAPDGSDVIVEFLPTLQAAREWAREVTNIEKRGW
jgi:hypothetical protein